MKIEKVDAWIIATAPGIVLTQFNESKCLGLWSLNGTSMNWIYFLYSIWHHDLFEHVECLGDIYLDFAKMVREPVLLCRFQDLAKSLLSLLALSCKQL